MSVPICRHIRYNGVRCGAPALRDKDFCFHHDIFAERHKPLNPTIDQALLERTNLTETAVRNPYIAEDIGYKSRQPIMLNLPQLDDRDAIQLAISMTVTAVGEYRLSAPQANSILFGIQLALANLRRYEAPTEPPVTETAFDADRRPIAVEPLAEAA